MIPLTIMKELPSLANRRLRARAAARGRPAPGPRARVAGFFGSLTTLLPCTVSSKGTRPTRPWTVQFPWRNSYRPDTSRDGAAPAPRH